MAEAGSIYFDLMQLGLVPSSDHLQELGSIGRLNAGRVQTGDVADHAYQVVWQMAADMFSSRLRLLLRPVPDAEVPDWTIYHSTQAPDQVEPIVTRETLPSTGTVHSTNWQQDYAEQGQRYALFVSEVLAELQHGTPQVVEQVPRTDSLTQLELSEVLASIIKPDTERRWTAEQLVPEVEKRKPGRNTSS
jgi:hypothetical protein